MSHANVEIVRLSTALLNQGDWDDLFDLYDPEMEFRDLRSAVDTPQVLKGVETVRSLLTAWSEAWEDFGAEVYDYIDADPYVVCDTRWYGTGRESGVAIDVRQADIYELRNGKVFRLTLGYASTDKALAAVGPER
jgi:ketosteroid isomerase-like protein